MRVALLNNVCRPRDAIGESVQETYRAITNTPGWTCRLFTHASDLPDVDTCIVRDATDVTTNPYFASADVIIMHFGFHSNLAPSLAAGAAYARRVVRFHNVTPKNLLSASAHPFIDRSMAQLPLLDMADEIWADSAFNRRDLMRCGVADNKIIVEPLFAKSEFRFASMRNKPQDRVNLLFVGRFVPSKGILDLVQSLKQVITQTRVPFHLSLVGAQSFSDQTYRQAVQDAVLDPLVRDHISILGELNDDALASEFKKAHLLVQPSYHEGFCIPLVEAMFAHAIPVVYNAGNMPDLISGVGRIVPLGDIRALGRALADLINWFGWFWIDRAAPLRIGAETLATIDYDARVAERSALYTVSAFHKRTIARLTALCGSNPCT